MAGIVTISGNSSSEPAGQRVLGPINIQGSIVVGDTVSQGLSSGDNTIAVPAGAVGVVIVPPSTGAVALKYRTSLNSGDGGLPIAPNLPFVHVFPSPIPVSIILNAGSSQTAFTAAWMW
jgi:hypothetical protein